MEATRTPQDLTHHELADVDWRISSHSGGSSGNCVAVGRLDDGRVVVRHSLDPAGEVLVYSGMEWAAFAADVRDGELDFG